MASANYQTGAIYETEGQARLAFEAIADLPLSRPEITLIEPDMSGADRHSVQAAQDYIRRRVLMRAERSFVTGTSIRRQWSCYSCMQHGPGVAPERSGGSLRSPEPVV